MPHEIYDRTASRGMSLIPRGSMLEVRPRCRLTPETFAVIRANKMELLAWLDRMGRDALPRQVLDGEFFGCGVRTANRIADELVNLPKSANRDASLVKLAEEAEQ